MRLIELIIAFLIFILLLAHFNARAHNENIYECRITRTVDGDTFIMNINLGFNVFLTGERIRLARVDAPSIRGSEKVKGLAVKKHVESLIKKKRCHIKNISRGKYRWVGEILLDDLLLSDYLLEKGYAKKLSY